ncbi:hypothetical protein KC343_g16351 [Hortaea werneckii]|nr:hypothetical protein KC352_g10706 [Hortaea werneckii]KAI7542903.1 hypothetical protein KC317_g16453 [Hortaea werneckii]KAI7591397.1 hypothetical protein KC346_g16313 [Hortaea werneckii]KAI7598573.1 hypothetical protein KC343_g16351 [Hortaea werneckii]KAI7633043.1 hypothetical protein KC319_g16048 [Hortaea werneckii]
MSEPSKDRSGDSPASGTMSKVNESTNPEPALSPSSSSGSTLPKRVATAEDSELVLRPVKALPLRAKEPQTVRQIMAGESGHAKYYSIHAQMYYYWSERLRDLYRGKKYMECRQGCRQLLNSRHVPHYKRIETLQLLSSVAGSALFAKQCLKEAQRRLDHLDSRKKSVQILLSENAILLETVKAHLTAEEDTEDDIKHEADELDPEMGGNIFLDNPPYFEWQASADASAEATGVESDDTEGFFAGREAQERWESMVFREEVKEFSNVIEEEDDDEDYGEDAVEEEGDDEADNDETVEEKGDDEADSDDALEEEAVDDPIEDELADKGEKAE